MATFSARFLGCKVSFADAQAIRERLLADGHEEVEGEGDVAVVNTCCVTHEAVSKSRQAVSRASRTHGRVYVTGLRGEPRGCVPASRRQRHGRVRAERRAAGRRRPRCRRDRLRAGRCSARADTRLRQDPGRVLVLVRVLRDPARARWHSQPPRAGGPRGDPQACLPRGIPRSCSRASTSGAFATARRATRSPAWCARRERFPAWSGSGCPPSR